MKNRLIKIAAAVLLFMTALSFRCSRHDSTTVLKLAHVLPTTHPVHRAMIVLADTLARMSDGRMRIDIYPGGVLGNERECLESLQIGSLDMTKVSSAVLENFMPAVSVLSLPYLFRDKAHRWRVFDGDIGRRMLLSGENVWLHGLCFYESGERNFYLAKKRVETPEDLHGLKIRVMRSNLSIRTVEALGAKSAPIAFDELFTAIAAGVVDGAENNIPTIHQSRHFEVSKYICMDGHSAPSDVLLISTHAWRRLTAREQRWLETAVRASVKKQKTLWQEATQEAFRDFAAAGVEVVWPDKTPFIEAVTPLYEEIKTSQPELYELAMKIKNLK